METQQSDTRDAAGSTPKIVQRWTIHPTCDLLPPMTEEEFAELKKDIAKNGVRVALVVHDGQIVDGRHRWRACQELGIDDPPAVPWDGKGSIESFVVSMNLVRRHLNTAQKADLALKLNPALRAEAKERQREHGGTAPGRATVTPRTSPRSDDGKATAAAARAVGVSTSTVENAKMLSEEAPETYAEVQAGKTKLSRAAREHKANRRRRRPTTRSTSPSRDGIDVAVGTIQDANVAPASIDCVIASIPMNGDPGDLRELARRVLKPTGRLLVVVRQDALLEVFEAISAGFRYAWIVACTAPPTMFARIDGSNVKSGWLPVACFANNSFDEETVDVQPGGAAAGGGGLRLSERGVRGLTEMFTKPGDVVLDPSMSDTAMAATVTRSKRRFVGRHADEAFVAATRNELGL